jgi:hypothetical protein
VTLQDNSGTIQGKIERGRKRIAKLEARSAHITGNIIVFRDPSEIVISPPWGFSNPLFSPILRAMEKESETLIRQEKGSWVNGEMANLIPSLSSDETAQAVLDDIFTSLNQADQRIRLTQESIDTLKVETRGMLDQLKELV